MMRRIRGEGRLNLMTPYGAERRKSMTAPLWLQYVACVCGVAAATARGVIKSMYQLVAQRRSGVTMAAIINGNDNGCQP